MKNIFKKIVSWLLRFLYIQLLVTLVSLPILLSWGLPISLLSPIGNLIFTPFLTVFLFLSSVIFFSQLLWIPNGIFVYALEKLTIIWTTITHYGSNKCLIGFAQPSWLFYLLLFVALIIIMHHKKNNSHAKGCIWLLLVLFLSAGYLKLQCALASPINTIVCRNGRLTLIVYNGTTVLIDPGHTGSYTSPQSWIEYTLVPELIKKYGITKLDHVIILKPGIRIFEAFETLAQTVCIKNCHCIMWQGTDAALNRAFIHCKKAIENNGGILHRFGTYRKKINQLMITPVYKNCDYRTIQYPACKISGTVGNEIIEITNYKEKKK